MTWSHAICFFSACRMGIRRVKSSAIAGWRVEGIIFPPASPRPPPNSPRPRTAREHPAPETLREAVYGLPELHRAELCEATLVSGTGCMATTAILGLAPLYRAGLVNRAIPLVLEGKIGSSAAGAAPGAGSR